MPAKQKNKTNTEVLASEVAPEQATAQDYSTTPFEVVGVDAGFGEVKAVDANENQIIFPSVIGPARELDFRADDLASRYPGEQITEEGDWFVGNLAQSQVPLGEQITLRGRSANNDETSNGIRLLFVLAALGKLFPGRTSQDVIYFKLATGLPVDYMADAASLKSRLLGLHRVQTDRTNFIANILEVMVMPQPYGTIYSQMLLPTGEINKCYTPARTGIVDVGNFTLDIAVDAEGEYIDVQSGSAEAGIWLAKDRIAAALEKELRSKISLRDIDTVLRTGCLKIQGKSRDYSQVVKEAVAPVITATLKLMQDKWGQGQLIDVIYVTGGGAKIVFEAIHAIYPQAVLVENAQIANAQGYLNYGLMVQRG